MTTTSTTTRSAATVPAFADLATSTSRLIRCTEPPTLDHLDPGDMVICEDTWGVDDFIAAARDKGVHALTGWYRYEDERVVTDRRRRGVLVEYQRISGIGRQPQPGGMFDPQIVDASRAAFGLTWDALRTPTDAATPYVPADDHLPGSIVAHLPFPTLNPAQVHAAPVMTSDDRVIVVAPTGAGKTVIGMMAALHEIQTRGRKAAWLVPQRSLTAELDRELDRWRAHGFKVATLSGGVTTDAREAQEADIWVATTEKFEALSRASSMREAVAQVGTLIVDEIHLLGEPARGPILESLLARVRAHDSPVRLVGLSATASNAREIAEWLGARLLTITWRPTRQTHQVLTVPNGSRTEEDSWRNAAAADVTDRVSRDGGSVLVFCGTKRNVRSAALAVAERRGVDTRGISVNDAAAVHAATRAAKVGLHYSDWPHKAEAEQQFRDRDIDVLVATSTLAAGVNTPARAVIVRDTSIGPQPMEVSMVQQMFGRAGRAGKEPEGWSFLVTALNETGRWRRRLADGYTIRSGILARVEDHLLSEVVQQNVTTRDEAERWWTSTLAYHQGDHTTQPLRDAIDFLAKWHLIDHEETGTITSTRLGAVTSRMMIGARDAASLLASLGRTPSPRNHVVAEDALIEAVADSVAQLANGPDAPPDQASRVLQVLDARGDITKIGTHQRKRGSTQRSKATGSQVAQAGLLLAARSPQALAQRGPEIAGVTRSLFNPVIYDAPRYLTWVSAAAELGAVPAWAAVVAHDLAPRLTWHRLGARRGTGRLLAWCERSISPRHHSAEVPATFRRIRDGRVPREQWPAALGVETNQPRGGRARSGSATTRALVPETQRWARGQATGGGLAVTFESDGDVHGTGWMAAFGEET